MSDELRIVSIHEFANDGTEQAEQVRRLLRGDDGWRLDPDLLTLTTTAGGYEYELDLETMVTSAEVLDWICQIAGKTWADVSLIGSLVLALDLILEPQANLCSSGQSKSITKTAIGERVRGLVEGAAS